MTVEIRLLPDPYSTDWRTWADAVAGYNPGLFSEVDEDSSWQEFANQFCQAVPTAPGPDLFEDWMPWAAAVIAATQW